MAFDIYGCKFDGLKQNFEKKLDFQWENNWQEMCIW